MYRIDLSRAVAPMVNQSDAPFRTLCLKYGASCVYTEMLYADRIVREPHYLRSMIPPQDFSFACGMRENRNYLCRPLVVQLCGNDPDILRQAVERLIQYIPLDGIDFNLGCPQERARTGGFGSYLLDRCHWPLVYSCVREMRRAIDESRECAESTNSDEKSISCKEHSFGLLLLCKIRICEGVDRFSSTLEFCRGLEESGANAICIHGRTRGSDRHRRRGPADINLIQRVAHELRDTIPVILNGNITTIDDVYSNLEIATDAAGVMSAEGILTDPALFSRRKNFWFTYVVSDIDWITADKGPDRFQLFEEYCELSEQYRIQGGWAHPLTSTKDEINFSVISVEPDSTKGHSKQIITARQHLLWMLGKEGHGRTVWFRYVNMLKRPLDSDGELSGKCYPSLHYSSHLDLYDNILSSSTIDQLRSIAEKCLRGVYASYPHQSKSTSKSQSKHTQSNDQSLTVSMMVTES